MLVAMDSTTASGRFFLAFARYSRYSGRACRRSTASARAKYSYSTSSNTAEAPTSWSRYPRHNDVSINQAEKNAKRNEARDKEIRNKIKNNALASAMLDESADDMASTIGPPYNPDIITQRLREAMRKSPNPVAIVTSCSADHNWPFSAVDPAQDPAIVAQMDGPTQEISKNRATIYLSPYFGSFCGATISSFTTVTMGPPAMISLNLKKPSRTLDGLLKHGYFRVHLLVASDKGARAAQAFVKDFSNEPPASNDDDLAVAIDQRQQQQSESSSSSIDNNPWVSLAARKIWTGLRLTTHEARQNPEAYYKLAPVIGGNGVVRRHIYCRVHKHKCVEVGDHTIVVGEVLNVSVGAAENLPREGILPGANYGLLYVAGEYISRGPSISTITQERKTEEIGKPTPSAHKMMKGLNLPHILEVLDPLKKTSATYKVIKRLHKLQKKSGIDWLIPGLHRFLVQGYHLDPKQPSTICIATALAIQIMVRHEEQISLRIDNTNDATTSSKPPSKFGSLMQTNDGSNNNDNNNSRTSPLHAICVSIKDNIDFRVVRIDEMTLLIAKSLAELPTGIDEEVPETTIKQFSEIARDGTVPTGFDTKVDGRGVEGFGFDEGCLVGVDRLLRKTREADAWDDLQEGLFVGGSE